MDIPFAFQDNGVKYYIFSTQKSVTVIGMSSTYAIQANGLTFKETLSKAKNMIEEAPLD